MKTEQVLKEIDKLKFRDISGEVHFPRVEIRENEIYVKNGSDELKYTYDPWDKQWRKHTKGWLEIEYETL